MSQRISIEFYTPDLPAPHAFSLQLTAEDQKEATEITFSLSYLDRETCTPEELEEDGYTDNDNIQWKGKLGKDWGMILFDPLTYRELSVEENNHFMHVTFQDKKGGKQEGFSSDPRLAYIIQELHQAILEATEKELPLSIRLKELKPDAPILDISILGSFLEREAFIIKHSTKKDKKQAINWSQLKDFMETIYTVDFDPDQALNEKQIQKGMYIEVGEGMWFQIEEEQKKLIETKLAHLLTTT